MVKCLPEFENFYRDFLKIETFFSKIRRSKVTDYTALTKSHVMCEHQSRK